MGQTEISPEVVTARVNFLHDTNVTIEARYVKLTQITRRQTTDQWSAVNAGAVYAWDLANAINEHALALHAIRAEVRRLAVALQDTVNSTLAADDSARTTLDSLLTRLDNEASYTVRMPWQLSPDGDPANSQRKIEAPEVTLGDRPEEQALPEAASSGGSDTSATAQQ